MPISRDLHIGEMGENRVQQILNNADIPTELNQDKAKRKYYDLISQMGKQKFTLEVKTDIYAAKSGNIAIEFYNPRSNKPSGINVTQADIWVYVFTDPSVWVCNTSKLKKYIEKNTPVRVINAGGDGNASLYLYKKTKILNKIFHRIDNMYKSKLKSLMKDLLK